MCIRDSDRAWQETVRDFAANRQFRRDIFVRGPNALSKADLGDLLGTVRMSLLAPRSSISLKFQGPLGEISAQAAVYEPLLNALETGPKTIAELVSLSADAQQAISATVQALTILAGAGHVHAMLPVELIDTAVTRRFNATQADLAKRGTPAGFLALGNVGTGMTVVYTDFLALSLLGKGTNFDPGRIAEQAWQVMQGSGQRLTHEGKVVETAEESIAQLTAQFSDLKDKRLPLYRLLGAW